MSRLRVLWHLGRADFLERVRRYGFLVTLASAVFLGYAVSAGHIKLWVGDVRGVYNSAWVGALMALVANTFLTLAGFYVVKNAVERDRLTGVGQILATTPMSRPLYALGKAASNLAVLLAMVAVLFAMGPVAQLVAGEESRIEVWKLAAPFFFLCLPAMAFVAAIAVLFEMVPGLRGGFGNVVWFFTWAGLLPASMELSGVPDFLGVGVITSQLHEAAQARFGPMERGFTLGALAQDRPARTFVWEGVDWTAGVILGQLLWLLVAAGVALLAALLFDRFDPSRGRARAGKATEAAEEAESLETGGVVAPLPLHLGPLPAAARRFRFLDLLVAELRLLLKGQRWWWYAGALGLLIASLAAPPAPARSTVLALAWIWPLLLWSPLGTRESRHAMEGLVFSAAHPLSRQLPATWAAGVLLALGTGSGVALRLALTGDWAGVGAWLIGALFIPTLALALGVWSGGSKAFEAIYLVLWYIGPLNQTPSFDFMGAVPAAVKAGVPFAVLAATALLGAAAVAGRRRQLAG